MIGIILMILIITKILMIIRILLMTIAIIRIIAITIKDVDNNKKSTKWINKFSLLNIKKHIFYK